ncbi:MAG: hypothetical protein ABF676_03100 [Schleiferilactobacillus harbinensis]|jgi:hypothetical protein|nr:hypothetical protein [Schleiferilactobacillus harbinensis]MCI1688607.1 hypothetical protein [Schleiferilactobacillus harbinensis]MCI1783541.1 hypothetical protein [Schleiferilactobacillus harbinensis]MCI1849680.1 hypothetical protein [Schleiferilactobacillus harbinensis]
MAALQRFALAAFWRNKKNIAITLFLALFAVGFLYLARYQGIGDQLQQVKGVQLSLDANVNRYNEYATGQKRKQAVYRNLLAQKQAYAEAQAGMLLGDRSMLAEGNLDVAKLQLAGYRLNYQGTADLNIPDEFTVRQNLVLAQSLTRSAHEIHFQINDASSYLILLMQTLGPWLFIILLLLTGDIWLDKHQHFSVLGDLPVTPMRQAWAKLSIGGGLGWLLISGTLVLAALSSGIIWHFGDWTYPVVTTLGRVITVPLFLALLLYCGLAFCLSFFTICLALLLNSLTHNVYATLFIGAAFWAVGLLAPAIAQRLWFLPTSILNLTATFSGAALAGTPLAAAGLWGPTLLLLLWGSLCLLLFSEHERRAGV